MRRAPSGNGHTPSFRDFEDSWEDHIDYCYDNEMEACCDVDWDGREPDSGSCRTAALSDDSRPATTVEDSEVDTSITNAPRFNVNKKLPPAPCPLMSPFPPAPPGSSAVTDLYHYQSSSSLSPVGANNVTHYGASAQTIGSPTVAQCSEPDWSSFAPSVYIPQHLKYEPLKEDLDEGLLAEYESCDFHHPIFNLSHDVRVNFNPVSKRSSLDSSIPSESTSGPGSIMSSTRRSASSATSMPELVYSRRAREALDRVVDHLAEQMATFADLEEDDEDKETSSNIRRSDLTEPRGHTFFSVEEEKAEEDAHYPNVGDIAEEIPVVLHQHERERAASESVAESIVRGSLVQARQRAATLTPSSTAHTLSLFPAPPRTRVMTP
ncbi:hypothetical protein W97_05885 [Coniosporium apollinis CBS 100218]|uniref:Uncharacterized protein n=1 Tax=Coniosporium apollinis (strain CBS 100218) TaxID=1168221 RepID=R7YXY7_CONA1|nr:uncharacterized protein W97_05885 [Coniosporium apollinis CBS 100218]EON66639.1 hypothetical protein W97_05885 [Coniosporium apollinis CBS 100218]